LEDDRINYIDKVELVEYKNMEYELMKINKRA
jgi:hypothetical protein